MTPILEKIEVDRNCSFTVRQFKTPCNEYIFHFHSEYEITYVKKGKGKRYIGGKLENFEPGDLVFIGKNISHYYINNEHENSDNEIIVIHFGESVLGSILFCNPEFESIRSLFERANFGLSFTGKTKDDVLFEMNKIQSLTGIKRVISLLQILNLLAHSDDFRAIGGPGFRIEIPKLSKRDFHRINIIFGHIENNYNRSIHLKEMASLIHMTVPAFCRYFKRVSRKSFTSFLNEFRIGVACKLLVETNMSVGDISYECGFNNIANFNRQFKLYVNTSPLKYKNSILMN